MEFCFVFYYRTPSGTRERVGRQAEEAFYGPTYFLYYNKPTSFSFSFVAATDNGQRRLRMISQSALVGIGRCNTLGEERRGDPGILVLLSSCTESVVVCVRYTMHNNNSNHKGERGLIRVLENYLVSTYLGRYLVATRGYGGRLVMRRLNLQSIPTATTSKQASSFPNSMNG